MVDRHYDVLRYSTVIVPNCMRKYYKKTVFAAVIARPATPVVIGSNGAWSISRWSIASECICLLLYKYHTTSSKILTKIQYFFLRRCISEGRCKPPTCEHGTYIKKYGRCPRREELVPAALTEPVMLATNALSSSDYHWNELLIDMHFVATMKLKLSINNF